MISQMSQVCATPGPLSFPAFEDHGVEHIRIDTNRGATSDRLRSFHFKQEANFLLYREVKDCPDAHESERLRQEGQGPVRGCTMFDRVVEECPVLCQQPDSATMFEPLASKRQTRLYDAFWIGSPQRG